MVSIVKSSRDTRRTVLYNEEKLTEKKAVFLGAFNYWQEDESLSLNDKLSRLLDLTSLNERSLAHTIHFSLNFHPAEELEDRKMRLIARDFLREVDFGDQPALVYRHLDAGHPHAHIVTVNIRPDGSRITNDKRSPHHLRKVCMELEWEHRLLPFGMAKTLNRQREVQQYPRTLEYGKTPTKTGIENVLNHILPTFNYTTLEELNALLSLYHVRADPGSEQGLMYQSGGLYYRMADERGVKVGAPIKASAFERKPTLDYLEQRYLANRLTRAEFHYSIKTNILIALKMGHTESLGRWKASLIREGIQAVTLRTPIRRKHAQVGSELAEKPVDNPAIRPLFDGHGFYYIDFKRRAVIRDTDLGHEYTAKSILQAIGLDTQLERMALNRELDLKPKQRALLERSDPDPEQKLRVLLELSRQHDHIVKTRWEQTLKLQQHHRHRLSL